MRVLHLDASPGWRGGQAQLAHLLGPEDGLVAPAHGALWSRASVPRWPFGLRGLWTALRAFRPDLLAAHCSRAHGLALLQGRAPVVVHRRVDFRPSGGSRLKYAAPVGYIAVSDAVRAVLVGAGVDPRRIRVVHDGVDPRPGAPREGPRALAVGALVPHKGHRVLVQAAALGGFDAWIAGEGPERPGLAQAIAQAGAPVRLLGARRDIPDLLASAQVFVHPSLEEGLGQAVLEARALGCRLVVSRAGGLPEAAGPLALYVPPGDPVALARAIQQAAALPRPAPDLPEPFTVGGMRARTRQAYASLLAGI